MHLRSQSQRLNVSDRRRITFYAAVFNVPTNIVEPNERGQLVRYPEIIRRGAFLDSLANGGEVVANMEHDDAKAFATRSSGNLLLQEDPHGLFCSCWLDESPANDAILADIASGALTACSFQFAPVESAEVDGVTERRKVRLLDVSLVRKPAYPGTEVHIRKADTKTSVLFSRLALVKAKNFKLRD